MELTGYDTSSYALLPSPECLIMDHIHEVCSQAQGSLQKPGLFPGLNSISLLSPVPGSVPRVLHLPHHHTHIKSLYPGVGLF